MSIFDILTLLGGLAMFLYGMRLMGDGLKMGSSGALKRAMEHVTNNVFKAFLLGLVVTAVIQSSTATIVITSGLVSASIISLRQSLGIIIGANVGTTVTGQIIRLLDIDGTSAAWLQAFKPSTLAPVALIIGIILIMGFSNRRSSKTVGSIAIGFGILFTGLLTMTGAVNTLNETGIFESMFAGLSDKPLLGYATGAAVAFILQSSSAAVGILQALSASGQLTFSAIYAIIVGIYLGDCVTTAIVCSIGTKADARRVGIVNILFNLCKTAVVLIVVGGIHRIGLLDGMWHMTVNSGHIANANTIFNLGCAILLFPAIPLYEGASRKIVRDKNNSTSGKYDEKLEALSSAFFNTPALALRSCYDLLLTTFRAARENIQRSFELIETFDEQKVEEVMKEEDNIDLLTDRVGEYLVALSQHLTLKEHVIILDHYYKVVTDFERLSDHAVNIAEMTVDMKDKNSVFSPDAMHELKVLESLLDQILNFAEIAFEKHNVEAAQRIEPMEEVVDDLVNAVRDHHIERLRQGICNVYAGTSFMNLLSDIERISDLCSNIGVATMIRAKPEIANLAHEYISALYADSNQHFNEEYTKIHNVFFEQLNNGAD